MSKHENCVHYHTYIFFLRTLLPPLFPIVPLSRLAMATSQTSRRSSPRARPRSRESAGSTGLCQGELRCDVLLCVGMWCDVMWCDVMWCDVMWCDVMWCDVMWCDVMQRNLMWFTSGSATLWLAPARSCTSCSPTWRRCTARPATSSSRWQKTRTKINGRKGQKNQISCNKFKKTHGRHWISRLMRIVAPIQVCVSYEWHSFLQKTISIYEWKQPGCKKALSGS